MTWKIKSEHSNVKFPNMNYCLGELNQKQISGLSDEVKNAYFEQDKPKKKKKLEA
jgi:hypothetical protein